jgi:hypothetical protein
MGRCRCDEPEKVEISFSGPLKIMMVDEPETSGYATLTIQYDRFSVTAKGDRIMYTLPVDKQVTMKVSYIDAHGNPATVDGEVIWASSDDDILNVQRNEDDTSQCRVMPMGTVGQAQVTATADADLGEGTRELICTAEIEIIGGEAVGGSITPVGEPTPIPREQQKKK